MGKKKDEAAVATLPESALTSMAALDDNEDVDTPVAFMGFYSPKSGRAGDIEQQLPGVSNGTPYVCVNGTEYLRVEAIQIMAGQQRYYTSEDDNGKILAASLTETDTCKKENVLTLTLVYSGGKLIPTVTTYSTSKVRAVRDFVSAAALTKGDEWINKQGPIGQRLVDLPPRLRVAGVLNMQQRTSKAGRIYYTARAKSSTLNDSQVETLLTSMGDETFNARLNEASRSAEGRWNWIKKEFVD
jgi:hypothetical protein